MTTIRGNAPISNLQRLDSSSTRIPFSTIDDGTGKATRGNIEEALGRVFPQLTQQQAELIARDAFEGLPATATGMDASAWGRLEPSVMQNGAQVQQQNLTRGVGTSGWLSATGLPALPPAMVGASTIPLSPSMYAGSGYMPRNDLGVTGYNPYQYPMGMPAPMLNGRMPGMPGYESPGAQAAKGAGRGILGFLKMMPVVGNIINGIDFVRDIGKGLSTWGNPNKTFGEKLKASADLLMHGAGMFVPQVGGAYDMAQGAVRMGEGMMRMGGNPMMMGMNPMMNPMMNSMGFNPMAMLPQFQYANAGIPNMYNMQFQNQMFQQPFAFNQFPNYSMYPPFAGNQMAFQPPFIGNQGYFNQPYPMMPYGVNPQMAAMTSPTFGTPMDGAMGAVREGVGMLKMAPGLGNILNGVDFVRDIGHLFSSMKGDPTHSFMKSAADLLFHGAGMFIPQIGGSYDMAQGAVRMGAGAMGAFRFGGLPPFGFNPMGIPPMYNSPYLM